MAQWCPYSLGWPVTERRRNHEAIHPRQSNTHLIGHKPSQSAQPYEVAIAPIKHVLSGVKGADDEAIVVVGESNLM
ncbi:MAG: hypothetical protein IIB77_04665 [Proteobacteria bacterium]|nr:hypothetical protein [Pseudomonadota bacterium]